MIRNVILVDIDHTLSNAAPRDGMIGPNCEWDRYHQASAHDAPLEDMVGLIKGLEASLCYQLVGFTDRPEKWRQLSMDWMVRHDVRLDHLLMRGNDDFGPSTVTKVNMVADYLGGVEKIPERVSLVLEDRDDVCAAFRAMGVSVLQVFARG